MADRFSGRAVSTRRLAGAVTEVALDGGSVVVKDTGCAAEVGGETAGLR
ncbi:hypothetical protein [Streptomyces sp. S.PB5]|nr:hypothetical protein [Streptomyces sp. S.PB5]MDN3029498.1 hypothetical protein [Streptomyces sp. S.PB5]